MSAHRRQCAGRPPGVSAVVPAVPAGGASVAADCQERGHRGRGKASRCQGGQDQVAFGGRKREQVGWKHRLLVYFALLSVLFSVSSLALLFIFVLLVISETLRDIRSESDYKFALQTVADFEQMTPALEGKLTKIEVTLDEPIRFESADKKEHQALNKKNEVTIEFPHFIADEYTFLVCCIQSTCILWPRNSVKTLCFVRNVYLCSEELPANILWFSWPATSSWNLHRIFVTTSSLCHIFTLSVLPWMPSYDAMPQDMLELVREVSKKMGDVSGLCDLLLSDADGLPDVREVRTVTQAGAHLQQRYVA